MKLSNKSFSSKSAFFKPLPRPLPEGIEDKKSSKFILLEIKKITVLRELQKAEREDKINRNPGLNNR